MITILWPALRASLVTLVLCGLAYPLALTGLAQWIMPQQANGSLERSADDTVIGSRLIGQPWNGPQWLHGRSSATTRPDPDDRAKSVPAPYNAVNSGAANLRPAGRCSRGCRPITRPWRRRSPSSPADRFRPTC